MLFVLLISTACHAAGPNRLIAGWLAFDKLHNTFRLASERPHDLTGLKTHIAVKIASHNFCIFLNLKLNRPPLAFADLIECAIIRNCQ